MNRKSDNEIRNEVYRELKRDSQVGMAWIALDVSDAVVTLTGIVTSYPKKLAAQEAAHRVAGVLDVANDIEVKPAGALARKDADIARAVRHIMEWDTLVPDKSIQSTVSDGWVTLEGDVGFWHEREEAERAVLRLEGVISVVNKIVVTPRLIPKSGAEKLKAPANDAPIAKLSSCGVSIFRDHLRVDPYF